MFFPKNSAVLALLIFICACNDGTKLTQANIDKAENLCKEQLEGNRAAGQTDLLQKWMHCRTEKIMPFDLVIYKYEADNIRALYSELETLAGKYDRHEIPLKQVYDTWDERKAQLHYNVPLLCVTSPDLEQNCTHAKESHSINWRLHQTRM